MWGVAVTVLKPFVLLWAGLNAIDDLALLIRVGRLCASVVPFPGKNPNNPLEMCGICDDVMGDLMRGNDGLSAIPCNAACLGLNKCITMCERLQEVSAESNEFPCIAAGFCDPVEAQVMNIVDPDCKAGPFFSCNPGRYCRRKRQGMKFTCELKPGIGRWVGMKHAAREHVVALAAGLMAQAHCGEQGAGPYCIARPQGFGLLAEIIGHFISLFIGSYKSILAIESRGGGDDRQWLTFWVILIFLLYIERFFARVLLSTFPWYYQTKLVVLIWLVWRSGADTCYRKLRHCLESRSSIFSDEVTAERELEIMRSTGKVVISKRLQYQASTRTKSEWKTPDWEYDSNDIHSSSKPDAIQQLYELSKYILSSEGAKSLEESNDISSQNKMLLIERAASVVSFQPRFLRVDLLGTIDDEKGQLPPMDRNGLADPYVMCRLVPENGMSYPKKGVLSKTKYKTLTPQWNQELEIPLRGGILETDGFFRCEDEIETTQLEFLVRDADVGRWHLAYYLFRFLAIFMLIGAAAARIEGLSDIWTKGQQHAVFGAAATASIGFVVSYVMAVLRRSDFEEIAQCTIPIGMLMDQREHTLLLTLRGPKSKVTEKREKVGSDGAAAFIKSDSSRGFGVIRVKLMLSER